MSNIFLNYFLRAAFRRIARAERAKLVEKHEAAKARLDELKKKKQRDEGK